MEVYGSVECDCERWYGVRFVCTVSEAGVAFCTVEWGYGSVTGTRSYRVQCRVIGSAQ